MFDNSFFFFLLCIVIVSIPPPLPLACLQCRPPIPFSIFISHSIFNRLDVSYRIGEHLLWITENNSPGGTRLSLPYTHRMNSVSVSLRKYFRKNIKITSSEYRQKKKKKRFQLWTKHHFFMKLKTNRTEAVTIRRLWSGTRKGTGKRHQRSEGKLGEKKIKNKNKTIFHKAWAGQLLLLYFKLVGRRAFPETAHILSKFPFRKEKSQQETQRPSS